MKLLLATEYFYPHWTGIAKAFAALATELQKQGNEITILTTQFEKKLPLHQQFSNVTIIRSPYQFKISRTQYSLSSILDFVKEISKNDIVIINSPHSNILFFTVIAKLFGKKVLVFHQGDLTLPRMTGSQVQHRIIEKIFDLFTIPSFFLADQISTYTEDYAANSRTMKFFMKKFFCYIPPIKILNTKYKIQNTRNVYIGFAGRFVEEKGFDILYQAMDTVVREIPNALFIFAGKKEIDYEPFYNSHKALFESQRKHVQYLGLLDEDNLAKFYQSLDVFVVSSRSECFALTQIEAALSGVPIVVTDIPGARILVKETGFGLVVKPNDPDDLARGVVAVVRNRERYMKNKDKVVQFLDTPRFLDSLRSLGMTRERI